MNNIEYKQVCRRDRRQCHGAGQECNDCLQGNTDEEKEPC